MKKLILKVLVVILKTIYLPFRLLKVKNKITYISRQSNKENIDFRLIREEMQKKHPEYKNVVLTKKIEDGILKKISYCINILKQMYHLATSKIIILDTYCITVCVLSHKKETKVIQIWHALSAIKKFGYQSIGTSSGSDSKIAKIMCMHQNYDYILAPSEETAKNYIQSFNTEKEKIKYIGMPRIDYTLQQDIEKSEKIYEKYKLDKNKKNILYVPTFRKCEKVEIDEFIKKIDVSKYNVIVKLHPLDLKKYEYINRDGIIYASDTWTYDLLKISDKIITDYSSLAMEAGLLNIPVYFYTYDIEKYKENPGLNFDFENEPIGKYQTDNVEKLLQLLEEEYDYTILKKFRQKYISVNTKNCTGQLVEFIMELINNEKIKSNCDKDIKKKQNI